MVPCQPDTRPRASPTCDVLMARKEGSHHSRVHVRLVHDGVQLLLLPWSSTCRVTASGATVWSVCHRRSMSIIFQFSRRWRTAETSSTHSETSTLSTASSKVLARSALARAQAEAHGGWSGCPRVAARWSCSDRRPHDVAAHAHACCMV